MPGAAYGYTPPGATQYGAALPGITPYGAGMYGMPPYGPDAAVYGYGYAGLRPQSTNSLATAALVVGLCSFFFPLGAPVAIGLGIAALVQIKRRQQSGTGLAVGGLVSGGLIGLGWAALITLGVVFGGADDGDYAGSEPAASWSGTTIDDLAVGDCFDDAGRDDAVDQVPCSDPHDGEVIGVETLADGAWPGADEIDEQSMDACETAFQRYVGIATGDSRLDPAFWPPDKGLWIDGDHTVVCAAYGPGGDALEGSVKGTKR